MIMKILEHNEAQLDTMDNWDIIGKLLGHCLKA